MSQPEINEVITNPERLLNPSPHVAQAQEIQKRTRRRYTDVEIASALIALDANGGNVFKTAFELGIPHKTLDEWQKSTRRVNDDIALLRSGNAQDLSNVMEQTARAYLAQSLDPYVVASTNGRDAVFAAAIAVDKMQLLRGLPTSIQASVLGEEERRLKVAELLTRIAERAEGQADQQDTGLEANLTEYKLSEPQ
jgi:hypothetical protein